jgi:hypothetical protein
MCRVRPLRDLHSLEHREHLNSSNIQNDGGMKDAYTLCEESREIINIGMTKKWKTLAWPSHMDLHHWNGDACVTLPTGLDSETLEWRRLCGFPNGFR